MSTRVIVRAPNHLGDCIMALPMISEVREAHPDSLVTVLAPETLADLYLDNPAVDDILRIPKQHVHGWIAVFKVRDLIAGRGFDVGYILPPSFGAASAFKLAGVPERIGYVADGRRLLLTKALPLPEPLRATHRAETYFNILRRASGEDHVFSPPRLMLRDDTAQEANQLLARHGVAEDDAYAAISFRAVAESRRWGLDNYTALVKDVIARHKLKVVLLGTAEDQAEGAEIVAAAGARQAINLAGRTDLRQLAGILARTRFFLGNDSGPAHLAAAVGAPVIVLSGADDPVETSPLAEYKRLIYLSDLDCISCVKNRCPLSDERFMRCMRDITLEAVVAEVDTLMLETL